MGSTLEHVSVPLRRSIREGGALVILQILMVASVAQGADVAGLKQAQMSLVDLNAY